MAMHRIDDIVIVLYLVIASSWQAKASASEVTQLHDKLRATLQVNHEAADFYRTQVERSWEEALLGASPSDPQAVIKATNLPTKLNIMREAVYLDTYDPSVMNIMQQHIMHIATIEQGLNIFHDLVRSNITKSTSPGTTSNIPPPTQLHAQ